jgi:hypothetical protein
MAVCILCDSAVNDEVQFGEFLTSGKVSVHQFCLVNFGIFWKNHREF